MLKKLYSFDTVEFTFARNLKIVKKYYQYLPLNDILHYFSVFLINSLTLAFTS